MKFKLLFCAVLFFFNACSQIGLITLNTAAGLKGGYKHTKNISYTSEKQGLDVYQPKKSPAKSPVVIFIHGGSWQSGDKKQYKFLAQGLTAQGFVVVVPNYRLYPQVTFPKFVEDTAQSLKWVYENINAYGGDAKNIFIMGHSAGAQIGALLTLDEHYLRNVAINQNAIRGFIGLAGPYNFLPFTDEVFKKIFAPKEKFKLSQPIFFVDGTEPPVLLLHGKNDTTVKIRNSITLADKIRHKGGSVQEIYFEKMSHTAIISGFSSLKRKKELVNATTNFITKQTTTTHSHP